MLFIGAVNPLEQTVSLIKAVTHDSLQFPQCLSRIFFERRDEKNVGKRREKLQDCHGNNCGTGKFPTTQHYPKVWYTVNICLHLQYSCVNTEIKKTVKNSLYCILNLLFNYTVVLLLQ